ncbi:CU044_2847 family protein [Glycomyces rhizosphaerae]|uniref:CU044_2847 family protein n=1 Tax=Glycomyces rhizosphaerae TaxID=2054422 RepID=A0ABV7PSY2_9ACTN
MVPVRIGDTEFLVETVATVDDPDRAAPGTGGGLMPISGRLPKTESFDRMKDLIQAVTDELGEVWEKTKPQEAVVEFGIAADVKAGKLTGILVGGGAAATLKITLKWTTLPGED